MFEINWVMIMKSAFMYPFHKLIYIIIKYYSY